MQNLLKAFERMSYITTKQIRTMGRLFLFFFMLSFGGGAAYSQDNIFELNPSQSMLMTGKGPGQDGAINPFTGQKSIAIVQNLGGYVIQVRIQNNGTIIILDEVKEGSKKEFVLEPGYELYFDSTGKTKVQLDFKEYKE